MQKKVTFVFGTRPEIIKLAPLIERFKSDRKYLVQTIFSNQHKDLAKPILEEFNIFPDVTLCIKRSNGDINELHSQIQKELYTLSVNDEKPDLLIVQGDTATSFSAALFAFQFKLPIAHVEAGLRSDKEGQPFPEELYRQMISKMSDLNFAPSEKEKENLVREGINPLSITVSGNTIVDAIRRNFVESVKSSKKKVLISLHRRESADNRGELIRELLSVAKVKQDFNFIFLEHPSNIKDLPNLLEKQKNIEVKKPMSHQDFLNLIRDCYLIITDSGGLQEEASYLEIETLIVRKTTERQDGLGKNIKLVGTDSKYLKSEVMLNLDKPRKIEERVENKTLTKSPSGLIFQKIDEHLNGVENENLSNRCAS